jgi:hypothetical protein
LVPPDRRMSAHHTFDGLSRMKRHDSRRPACISNSDGHQAPPAIAAFPLLCSHKVESLRTMGLSVWCVLRLEESTVLKDSQQLAMASVVGQVGGECQRTWPSCAAAAKCAARSTSGRLR